MFLPVELSVGRNGLASGPSGSGVGDPSGVVSTNPVVVASVAPEALVGVLPLPAAVDISASVVSRTAEVSNCSEVGAMPSVVGIRTTVVPEGSVVGIWPAVVPTTSVVVPCLDVVPDASAVGM